ncbi:serine/threonine protein kinase [Nocardioides zeae]|uniref:Serine/threonine protein kinase n=1 Tax=Nocardioides zeae TaxID=1457234 RepID=A0ACC6IF19_9ACTN|nr:serine/threonine-protein kinase [Nocardioides zeae]MDR6174973.1 serine/threonine protein kinase [Nocardioides zeae]MDR6209217.1 serine/threonine protein kinase [Nocardioides zeae]
MAPRLPAPGDVIDGRYELVRVLGRGGMAVVLEGRDLLLERPVAVKVLSDVEDDERAHERFVAEARLLAGLHHPRLVTVLDAGTVDGRPHIVMELVPGSDLAAVLREGPLPPDRVARLGAEVAEALAHAHAAGIVHRDVKPGNVLVEDSGHVRLADFGIARLAEATTRHTRTGTVIGSPVYLAPEQVAGETVTTATDLYSLGLLLLEALTGEPPFTGTQIEVAMARLTGGPTLPPNLPAGWPALLRDLTAREPAERPDAATAEARLRALADGSAEASATAVLPVADLPSAAPLPPPLPPHPGGPAPSSTAVLPTRDRDVRRPRRAPLLAAVGVVVVLGLVGGTALALGTGDGDGGGSAPDVPAVPADAPADLQDPLTALHDAVEEATR